ncbi:GNAT family N-acetyltransferase [Clostridium sp. SHJSY1]|uniref:GNAT family N-acetyltransferase n=1 Tax=Clostridium sp. SHJSY1 TaxID=2942483 RepID=UPI0028756BA4|nr:GNAT family N-acetyltransferase [Clostridium sp. SHJSY1]MDS0524578.1 GNAT family N-acetyltransferase [Clostridium sp. SHJSY1]
MLRPWQESDYLDVFEYAKDPRVGPNAGWPIHKTEDDSKRIVNMFIKNKDCYAVVLKNKNKVIGSIGLHKRIPDENKKNLNQREIGYVLNPAYWGNEYIPEAVNLLIKFGFEKLHLDIIWCGHYNFNKNSKRVVEKCGFIYRFNKDTKLKLLDNKIVNELYYSITRNDYYNV